MTDGSRSRIWTKDDEVAGAVCEMQPLTGDADSRSGKASRVVTTPAEDSDVADEQMRSAEVDEQHPDPGNTAAADEQQFKLYFSRFYGLAQLVLLNIVISWNWLTFAAISTTASDFFGVTVRDISWLSTGFLFAFVPASLLTIWVLNKGGPKYSILVASVLVLLGNWIRYGGVRASPPSFGVVMFGQILIGFSQPFVLAAPTRYSNLWFSDKGRVSATALASLANPFGGALGQLIGPLWATDVSGVPNMVLYTAIISTVATLPAPFIPRAPPSPPSALAASSRLDLGAALRALPRNPSSWLLLVPFSVYVGFFNALSSLLNQILYPYAYTETDAGIAGALLILIGLAAGAVVSPLVDRSKRHSLTIKLLVPVIAAAYVAFIFMPATRSVAGPWAVCSILGAASFALLPTALEYLVLVTHPVAPELASTVVWAAGQLLGGIFIVIMDALQGGWSGEPPRAMTKALVFQAVVAVVAVPFPMWLGVGARKRDGVAAEGLAGVQLGL